MGEKLFLAIGSLNRVAPYFRSARGEGLTILALDEDTLAVEQIAQASGIDNPTFLSVDAASCIIYANSEVSGWHEGTVSAFRFEPGNGALIYLNKQPTLGSITAHNTVSRDRKTLWVANYAMGAGGGPDRSVVALPIREDGSLGPASASIRLEGELGPVADRQERPHAHMVTEVPEGAAVLVADLGLDRVAEYAFDGTGFRLKTAAALPPGSGPRHIAQHANGRYVYVANELASTVSFILREAGGLSVRQTLSAIRPGSSSYAADIVLSPDRRFLYISNRGEDSIACFSVDPESGMLALMEIVSCGGETPRNLALTPGGRHLIVANQDSDQLAILRRNVETGALSDIGVRIEVGTPMCVRPFRPA